MEAVERAGRFLFVILVVRFAYETRWGADSKPPKNSRWLAMVSELIAALTPRQLNKIYREHWDVLRLRWRDGDEATLADIHLHAKVLLSGELIALGKHRSQFPHKSQS